MSQSDAIRVLAVDDDPDLLKLIDDLLTRVGMEARTAESAEEAAKILQTEPLPDVILLDLMMPGISGLTFLKQLRRKKMFDNLPVIIVSALPDPEDIRKGLEAGADRYLTKPYLAANLVKTVREVLKTGRARK